MANVAIFKIGKIPRYLESINTPDYSSDPDVIVNPNMSGINFNEPKFWKRVGDTVVEMDASEKQAILDAEQSAKDTAVEKLESIDAVVLAKALVATGKITKAELITAIKGVLNG